MPGGLMLVIAVTVGVVTLIGIVLLLIMGGDKSLETRLGEISESGFSGGGNRSASQSGGRRSTSRGTATAADPREKRRQKLEKRLIQAGLYKKNSTFYFIMSQMILLASSILLGFGAASMGLASTNICLLIGGAVGVAGIITPGFVLDHWKKKRQTAIRRALPDALDVIIVCVEAGLSLPSALVRVASELKTAHPMLAGEMTIVHREVQMGNSTGESLRNFADRFDLEELRSLSSVVQQAEKFGASIVTALRVHGDVLRRKRFQQAQERAQKAAVKLLFPTVLCIFPAMFIVILGPAAFNILKLFSELEMPI